MSKKKTRQETLIEVAEMYYIQGMSQEEIAKQIESSRSNVSRLLKLCVSENIVEFKINKTTTRTSELENDIKYKYGLKHVIVVPKFESEETSKRAIGSVVAKYLSSILKEDMDLAVAWGTTLFEISEAMDIMIDAPKNLDIYQMLGGMGANNVDTDGLHIVKQMSEKLGATPHLLHAPLLVQSKVLRDLLLEEPMIEEHYDRLKNIDVMLLGIGSIELEQNAIYRAGYITEEDVEKILSKGAKADLAGYSIDAKGDLCVTHISDKIINTSIDKIEAAKMKIGAAVGVKKVEAVKAVLNSGQLNVLAIDEYIAEKLI